MLMDLISDHHRDELGDPSEQQVGMQGLFIPGLTPGNTKTVLEMVDGSFHSPPDLIDGLPSIRAAEGARISPQVLFRIEVEHAPTGGSRTGIFAMADALALSGRSIILPLHLGTDGLHGGEAAAQMRPAPLTFHGEGRIFWAAGDTSLI